jgi:hypothetical protein
MFQKFRAVIEGYMQPPPVAKIMQTELYEAERLALAHDCTSEYHEALAMMYRSRADRLRDLLGHDKIATGQDLRPLSNHMHASVGESGVKWKGSKA